MIANRTIPTVTDPELLDAVLLEMQTAFSSGLSWLGNAYGKAQRLIKNQEGTTIFYPAVYAGGVEYLNMFPDEHLQNHVWFDVDETETGTLYNTGQFRMEMQIGIVFWFDFKTVFSDWESRTIEHVKRQVMDILGPFHFTTNAASFEFTGFKERAANIYSSYTHREINNQFLMRPYGGFRVEGIIQYNMKC